MKIVIVLDPDLPPGLQANAAAVLGFSASRQVPGGIGPEVADADGGRHPGITSLPIPVLACPDGRLADLRAQALALPGVACVDFSDVAQRARRYEDYTSELGVTPAAGIRYLGLCLFGEPGPVRRLTGNLPLVS
jgi:hypothetical protein